jgi:hypothetical protein
MKRSEVESWVIPQRFEEEGRVYFEAHCRYGEPCCHTDASFVHSGGEKETRDSVVSKMVQHYVLAHGITLEG